MPPKRREPATGLVPMSFEHNGKTINYTITQKEFDDIERIKENAPIINKQTTDMCIDIQADLQSAGIPAVVTTRPFRDLTENEGYEFINPRNYLTNERVEVSIGNTPIVFFWGRYADLPEAKEKIINHIKNGTNEPKPEKREIEIPEVQRAKREQQETTGTDSGDVTSIRSRLRVRKFQGDS